MTAEFLTHESLSALGGIRHGFFTRNGGVSEGLYASLNLGAGSDDKPQDVAENKRRVAEAMGVEPSHLLTLWQCHSRRVLAVDRPFAEGDNREADGFVTATPGLALGILTADCAPVLLADAQAKVVGACHAGWKGAIQNIMLETVEAMEKLGAKRGRITAVVGPCIAQESYEVGKDFHDAFVAEAAANVLFFEPGKAEGKFLFDLPAYVCHTLQLCGVAASNVLAKDTCNLENAFFSNRRRNLRGESDYGRQVSVIMLEP